MGVCTVVWRDEQGNRFFYLPLGSPADAQRGRPCGGCTANAPRTEGCRRSSLPGTLPAPESLREGGRREDGWNGDGARALRGPGQGQPHAHLPAAEPTERTLRSQNLICRELLSNTERFSDSFREGACDFPPQGRTTRAPLKAIHPSMSRVSLVTTCTPPAHQACAGARLTPCRCAQPTAQPPPQRRGQGRRGASRPR